MSRNILLRVLGIVGLLTMLCGLLYIAFGSVIGMIKGFGVLLGFVGALACWIFFVMLATGRWDKL